MPFGAFGIFTYLKIGLAVIIFASISYLWYDYSITKKNLVIAKQNQEKLQSAIKEQNDVLKMLQQDLVFINESYSDILNQKQAEIRELANIREKFRRTGKRSFEELLIAKPGLVQNIINKGTEDILLCIEKASGAKGVQYDTIKCD